MFLCFCWKSLQVRVEKIDHLFLQKKYSFPLNTEFLGSGRHADSRWRGLLPCWGHGVVQEGRTHWCKVQLMPCRLALPFRVHCKSQTHQKAQILSFVFAKSRDIKGEDMPLVIVSGWELKMNTVQQIVGYLENAQGIKPSPAVINIKEFLS